MSQEECQAECQAEWIKLKSEMRERIRQIDLETPAEKINPNSEPEWWLEMMGVLRKIAQ